MRMDIVVSQVYYPPPPLRDSFRRIRCCNISGLRDYSCLTTRVDVELSNLATLRTHKTNSKKLLPTSPSDSPRQESGQHFIISSSGSISPLVSSWSSRRLRIRAPYSRLLLLLPCRPAVRRRLPNAPGSEVNTGLASHSPVDNVAPPRNDRV